MMFNPMTDAKKCIRSINSFAEKVGYEIKGFPLFQRMDGGRQCFVFRDMQALFYVGKDTYEVQCMEFEDDGTIIFPDGSSKL